MKITKASFIYALCFSFFALTGCGSTSSVDRKPITINTTPVNTKTEVSEEKNLPEISNTETPTGNNSVSELSPAVSIEESSSEDLTVDVESTMDAEPADDSLSTEESIPAEESVPAEKIDENEILQNEIQINEDEPFVEPDVQDVVFTDDIELPPVSADSESVDADDEKEVYHAYSAEPEEAEPQSADEEPEITHTETVTTVKPVKTVTQNSPAKNKPVKPQVQQIKESKKESASTPKVPEQKQETSAPEQESNIDIFNNLAVIVPSRSMTVKNNQYVDVVYPGAGWIYIGETETDPRFRYFGRKLGSTDTTFTLRSIKPGKTYLHFYKNDVLTAQYIDDYLEVTVINSSAGANEKATAPSYSEVVPPKPVRSVTVYEPENQNNDSPAAPKTARTTQEQSVPPPAASSTGNKTSDKTETTAVIEDKNVKTIIQNTEPEEKQIPSAPAVKTITSDKNSSSQQQEKTENTFIPDSSKSLLEQAKDSLKAQKYSQALYLIRTYLDSANSKIDEALYVQGQILEADSEVKDIRSAIDSYDSIIKKYPASKYWQKANKRKIYLNRFYVNIY